MNTAITKDTNRLQGCVEHARSEFYKLKDIQININNVPPAITIQDALIVIKQAQEAIDAYKAVQDSAMQLIHAVIDRQVIALYEQS